MGGVVTTRTKTGRTTYEAFEAASAENRRLLRQEGFILDVTEALCEQLEREGVTRAELARRLGRTRGFVSQALSGANLTLRTIADIADALGRTVEVRLRPGRRRVTAGLIASYARERGRR